MIRLRPGGREGPNAARRTGSRDWMQGPVAEAGLGAGPAVGTGRRGGQRYDRSDSEPPVQGFYIKLHLIKPSRDE